MKFYKQLRDALRTTKKNEINIVLAHFNAKVGQETVEEVVEKHDFDDGNN